VRLRLSPEEIDPGGHIEARPLDWHIIYKPHGVADARTPAFRQQFGVSRLHEGPSILLAIARSTEGCNASRNSISMKSGLQAFRHDSRPRSSLRTSTWLGLHRRRPIFEPPRSRLAWRRSGGERRFLRGSPGS
jgi:hypothetical protein